MLSYITVEPALIVRHDVSMVSDSHHKHMGHIVAYDHAKRLLCSYIHLHMHCTACL